MSLLACGDVGGSVYLFDTTTTTSKEWIVPSHVASRTHGKFAVNVVTWHRSSKDLYSASQDGMICRFRTRLVEKKRQLCHVESFRPSLTANISRIWWKDKCMFLAGFSSNEFRVINQTTHRIAMSVKRISYRRPWDVLYDDENDTEDILHVYAKNNGDRITKREMKKNKKTPRGTLVSVSSSMCPRMYRYPYHSRRADVAAMCSLQESIVVVSGGENREVGLTCIETKSKISTRFFHGHPSGIRSLCVAKWSDDEMTYLFSGGGTYDSSFVEYPPECNSPITGTDTIIAWNLVSSSRLDMLCRHDLHVVVDATPKKVIDQKEKRKIDFKMRKKKRKQKFDKKRTTSYAEQRVLSLSKLSGHCVLSTDSSGRIQVLRIQAQTSRVGSNGTHQHCKDTTSHEIVRMYQCVRRIFFVTQSIHIHIISNNRYRNQDLHFVPHRFRTVLQISSQSDTRTAL